MKYDRINAELVPKAALKAKRGSGPSGMDADRWRSILLSNNFGNSPMDLCKAIAKVIKKLCTEKVSHRKLRTIFGM